MKIEKQVSSILLSEKLYDIGVRGETLYYHTKSKFGILPFESIDFKNGYVLNAFTVAELGRMLNVDFTGVLPEKYNKKEINAWFEINTKNYQSEADLRAGILLYLLQSGLLAVSTCNKRLVA